MVIFSEGLCQGRRAISEEGRQGLHRGPLQTRKWTDQSGVEKYSTEVVLQGFNSNLTMLDGAAAAAAAVLGRTIPAAISDRAVPRRRAAPRGGGRCGGRGGDMDDEIPF